MNAPLRTNPFFARALLFFVIFGGFAAPTSAGVILSEIFYDAEGSDDGHVFVELAGPPGTLLRRLVGGRVTPVAPQAVLEVGAAFRC